MNIVYLIPPYQIHIGSFLKEKGKERRGLTYGKKGRVSYSTGEDNTFVTAKKIFLFVNVTHLDPGSESVHYPMAACCGITPVYLVFIYRPESPVLDEL